MSDVWRNVRVPTSLRNAPTRFSSRVLVSLLAAVRLANSSSFSSPRRPNSVGRYSGTLRKSSLDHVPEISGSPHGVLGTTCALAGADAAGVDAGRCATRETDNAAAAKPIVPATTPTVCVRISNSFRLSPVPSGFTTCRGSDM